MTRLVSVVVPGQSGITYPMGLKVGVVKEARAHSWRQQQGTAPISRPYAE